MDNKDNGLFTFLFGAVVGAAIALLYAPKTGKETRSQIKKIAKDFVEDAEEVGIDLKEKGKKIVEEGKVKVSELVEKGKSKYSKTFKKQEEEPVESESNEEVIE